MAADKITIDLDLNARKAQREVAALQKKIDALGKSMSKGLGGVGGRGGVDKVRALGTGLSKATVRADEFNKSLEASNARVIAFGASAGLIMQVERALRSMVVSAVKVEKAMADVNVVMNVSTKTLEQFGRGMFKVAKDTAQSFDTVSEAATELARQGLSVEKTLSRTKDALILTRLTGMNAADAVKSLTAAVNSFNKEGVTSAQVINRMAKVDAAFAVSSEDLAKSISRVGSSAVDAGVSLNQLMAITTSVQQKTARGGAVIGNAFKTIFTRIQRSDVRKTLADIGVATTDMNGKMLDGVTVLENLSRSFGRLTKVQQASVAENVAGVFQVNILRAAMSDLVNKNSEYAKALRVANTATNEAFVRNEELNKTLDALANRTLANLTSAGAAIGGGVFEPAIRKVLEGLNSTIESFGKGGAMEGVGDTIGKGLMAGIGNFISGPGLILVTAAFGKLALNLGKFATTALKDFMGLNTAVKQRAALEEMVIDKLRQEPALVQQIAMKERTVLDVQREILRTMELQTAERAQMQAIATPVARGMYSAGARVTPSGFGAFGRGRPGRNVSGLAGGFIPNFASAGAERAAAAAGGYQAGAIRTMSQPGAGTMMYNSAETVKQFPGMTQKAIMPPQNSAAGVGYKAAFGAAHGFDPYAAGGFVPNFAGGRPSKSGVGKDGYGGVGGFNEEDRKKWRNKVKGHIYKIPATDIGVLLALSKQKHFSENLAAEGTNVSKLVGLQRYQPLGTQLKAEEAKVQLMGVRFRGYMNKDKEDEAERLFSSQLNNTLEGGVSNLAQKIMGKLNIQGSPLRMAPLSESVEGGIFEEAMRMAMGASVAKRGAAFDFNANSQPSESMQRIFGEPPIIRRIDAKRSRGLAIGGEIPKKYFNDNLMSGRGIREIMRQREVLYSETFKTKKGDAKEARHGAGTKKAGQLKGPLAHMVTSFKRGKAMGFVPNFSPLTSAIGREMAAGVPASAIRVGSSPALRSAGNPGGVGVYNTFDEPAGLGQGVSRARRMGLNPKTHGAAEGFVPNYTTFTGMPGSSGAQAAKQQEQAANKNKKSADNIKKGGDKIEKGADKMMMAGMMINMALSGAGSAMGVSQQTQGGINALSNIGGMALMGAGFGPAGIAAGAALGTLTSMGDIGTALGFRDAEIAAEEMKKVSAELKEGFGNLKQSFGVLENFDTKSPLERITALTKIVETVDKIEKGDSSNKVVASMRKNLRSRLSIDKVLKEGNLSSLPAGQLERMEKELVDAQAEILAATQGQDMSTLLAGMVERADMGGSESVMGLRKNGGFLGLGNRRDIGVRAFANPEKTKSFVKGRFTPEVQAKLLAVPETAFSGSPYSTGGTLPSGVDALKDIGGRAAGIQKEIKKALEGDGRISSKESEIIINKGAMSVANDLSTLFGRANLPALKAEIDNSVNAINKTKDPEGKRMQLLALSNLMATLSTDQSLQIFRNPEGLAAPTKGKGQDAASQMTQGEFDALRRQERIGRAEDSVSMGVKLNRRLGRIRRRKSSADVDRANRGRMAGITMAGDALIDEQAAISKEAAQDKARAARKEIIAKQQAKLDQKELKAFGSMVDEVSKLTKNLDDKNELIKKYNEQYRGLEEEDIQKEIKRIQSEIPKDDAASNIQQAQLTFLEQMLIARKQNNIEEEGLLKQNRKSRKNEIDNIEAGVEARKQELRAMEEFQHGIEAFNIQSNARKTANRAAGLREMRDHGIKGISGREIAAADKAARRAAIRERGVSAADPGAAFREVFAYNEIDAVLEFEDGVVSVAENMKSSFADAFRAIASGSATAGEAIGAMAQSILDSISQVSTNMFSSMLFQQMGMGGKAQGGYIPGYNSGGLITGGSGYKDDVPIHATGGEFVIKKSAVNKIGVPTLNAINGMANGGPSLGKVGMIAAGASAASGLLGAAMQPGTPDPAPSQNYGFGRSKHGYLGGADPDARGPDMISGGSGRASASLNKAYVYYRRDPQTGQLISERARPTEGRFEVSDRLSLLGRLGEDDPQTARMFQKEEAMSKYQGYLAQETSRRKAAVKAVERKKRGNLIQAYANAAMLIGGAYMMDKMGDGLPGSDVGGWRDTGVPSTTPSSSDMIPPVGPSIPSHGVYAVANGGGKIGGGMIAAMGGEYVMSPEAVRTHGINFMTELNRGNVPGYASGGLVGAAPAAGGGSMVGGSTTNNVSINVNIDKNGKASTEGSATSQKGGPSERDERQEVEDNKQLGEVLQGVVLQEIVRQQRPGGLLNNNTTGVS